MTSRRFCRGWIAAAVVLACGGLVLAGCHRNAHPDDRDAVYNSLAQNKLRSVEVAEDREAGVITLRGIVGGVDAKGRAETLAQQAAPGYQIRNQIQVQSADLEGMEKAAGKNAALDSAIEDTFKARIQGDKKLQKQKITYSADNGTLYLKGTVKTEGEKRKFEDLARKVPQVQQVVNDIAVKPS